MGSLGFTPVCLQPPAEPSSDEDLGMKHTAPGTSTAASSWEISRSCLGKRRDKHPSSFSLCQLCEFPDYFPTLHTCIASGADEPSRLGTSSGLLTAALSKELSPAPSGPAQCL